MLAFAQGQVDEHTLEVLELHPWYWHIRDRLRDMNRLVRIVAILNLTGVKVFSRELGCLAFLLLPVPKHGARYLDFLYSDWNVDVIQGVC